MPIKISVMQKMYTFIILCLLFVKLGAQKTIENDFIINLNGETIIGEIKLQALPQNYQMCYFKAPNQKEYQAFNPTQIKGFFAHKTYFESKFSPDTTLAERSFFECYFNGKYSLFGKGNKLYIEYDDGRLRPFEINGGIVSKDGALIKRPDKEFIDFLQKLGQECPGLGIQIQANVQSYDLKSCLDLFEDYHNCLKIPFKRYGISKEKFRFQWEVGTVASASQMPLKSSFLGLDYYNFILHQGVGIWINAALVVSPQRYVFFPSLVIAPELGRFDFQQNDARFTDGNTNKSTYIESQYQASIFGLPIYLRQPFARVGHGFLSFEVGTRLEAILNFSNAKYLIETEGLIDRQYSFVETELFDAFQEVAKGTGLGIMTGVRLSLGDENNSTGNFALGFRYSRTKQNDPNAGSFDQPILLRSTLFSIYLSKRL